MRLQVNDRDAYRAINTIALRARIKNRFVSERLAYIYIALSAFQEDSGHRGAVAMRKSRTGHGSTHEAVDNQDLTMQPHLTLVQRTVDSCQV